MLCDTFGFSGFKDAPLSPHLVQLSYTDEQLYKDSLKLHNDYRLKHGSGPLTLNKMVSNNKYIYTSISITYDVLRNAKILYRYFHEFISKIIDL